MTAEMLYEITRFRNLNSNPEIAYFMHMKRCVILGSVSYISFLIITEKLVVKGKYTSSFSSLLCYVEK